jgi:diphosphomevalonate decarboxylase
LYNSHPFHPGADTMRAAAIAQPNIALIKYWGKSDTSRNLPAVGSISVTLDELSTVMRLQSDETAAADVLIVNGEASPAMLPRVSRCLDGVMGRNRPRMRVTSECNFPIAAGLASSASAFAALVTAADSAALGNRSTAELATLAGRASGSAARSLFAGFVELLPCGDGIDVRCIAEPMDWPLRVVVALTALEPKAVGSSRGMEISRRTSPFYQRWLEQQPHDLELAERAIADRDFAALGAIAEHSCLKMHSVMWGSRPPLVYWNSATLECMQALRVLQAQGVEAFFTIDAGPQVKVVCTAAAEADVVAALRTTAGVEEVMACGLGPGASVLPDA